MNADNMMATIISTVSLSLSASLSSSGRTDIVDGTVLMKKVFLIPFIPPWESLSNEKAAKFCVKIPTSISALAAETTDKCINDFSTEIITLKVGANPFAKGAMRATYYAQELLSSGATVLVAVKESMAVGIKHQTRDKYESYLACQAASIFLANEFNKLLGRPAGFPTIDFCTTSLLQFNARPGQPFFIQESVISGKFEKYNNNAGLCIPSPTTNGTIHEAVQAFSHWTYIVSGKKLMVVDCQGCFNAAQNKFSLTDPAIHCSALARFGSTNMGPKGFENFFKTHRCNDVCKNIGNSAEDS
jgi:elongation factor 2 kinase